MFFSQASLRATSVPETDSGNKCTASADSFSDYGQFAISQSGLGHIMFSAATAQSTMDFSTMPVEDGVVDSPPNGGKRPHPVTSPSPLKCRRQSSSPRDGPSVMQRKLYDEEMGVVAATQVWWFLFFHLESQHVFQECMSNVFECKSLISFQLCV